MPKMQKLPTFLSRAMCFFRCDQNANRQYRADRKKVFLQ